ncbi:hypothetical protein [Polaromonas sp. YR568]|uniref:hypothetical protein n=1 Tax=Polaromonas sp. YR568 TaxID=1855301 RepID=UPI00398BD528
MIRLASAPAPNLKLLARSALTMLSSSRLMKESNCQLPATSAAALDVLRDWAKGSAEGPDRAHPGPILERQLEAQAPDHPLDIAVADWDILFRAVKIRLMLSVGEKLTASTPPSQAGEAAELVRSIVLECVGALNQLHQALTQERGRRDPSATLAPGAQATEPAALA